MKRKNSYPIKYINPVLLKDGKLVQLRPIHPVDGKQAELFKSKLSAKSIYDRFLGYIPKIEPKLVSRLTEIDYDKEMAIVAETTYPLVKEIIAVARIASVEKTESEFAIIIADKWQSRGLGKIMTDYMIEVAKDMGFEKIYALVFNHNVNMLEMLRQRDFTIKKEDATTYYAELKLK